MQKTADAYTNKPLEMNPDTKLKFLKVIFDKLDENTIKSILATYYMSVESALDELLDLEAQRALQEELKRKKLDDERMKKEREERLLLEKQRQEIERNNKLFQLQARFPTFDSQLVRDTLQTFEWDYEAAFKISTSVR